MKKCLATALFLITGCSTDVYIETTSSSSTKETITIISSFLELGREETVDAAKVHGGAENVKKQKPSKHS